MFAFGVGEAGVDVRVVHMKKDEVCFVHELGVKAMPVLEPASNVGHKRINLQKSVSGCFVGTLVSKSLSRR